MRIKIFHAALLIGMFTFWTSCTEKQENQPENGIKFSVSETGSTGKTNVVLKFSGGGFAFDSAGASLDLVELRTAGQPGQNGKFVRIWNQFEYFDLLNMTGGIMVDIGFLPIPPGTYDEARCHVWDGWVSLNGTLYECTFPGERMVLKFSPAVTVGEHLSEDLDLSIDLSSGFIPVGNPSSPSSFTFMPNVDVANNTVNGTLVGMVFDGYTGEPLSDARVWIWVNGQPLETFTAGMNDPYGFGPGSFVFPGIPEGNYQVFAENAGYAVSETTAYVLRGNYNSTYLILIPE